DYFCGTWDSTLSADVF
nr:immunoglobulin light chain junction region [Macaca mulatta]MOX12352.1 immunoglobulin light chain junction region [Macaca mulatta]MOX12765.1 immunoglobulin light chain junction region [Macaca mulatta]MOX13391.1 immunoglobulin light chain junction region [Macaca mulatta]